MRVGTIPFRQKKGKFQICLISSLSKPGEMTFPKGWVKSDEGWVEAALREMREEAGLKGRILMRRRPLVLSPRKRPEESCIFYWCRVDEVKAKWRESRDRDRIWHNVGGKMDFKLTDNAKEIYRELLKLGLDKEVDAAAIEDWLRGRLLGLEAKAVTVPSRNA